MKGVVIMTLKPYVKQFLQAARKETPHSPIDMVRLRGTMTTLLPPVGPRPSAEKAEDRLIPGPNGAVPVRMYTPSGKGPFPLFIYIHGGGWTIGSIEEYDTTCRLLASETGAKVISVEYRLAPEHPFPAGLEDCYAAAEWIFEHAAELNGDPTNLTIGGDNAGGNLSAAVALMARDRNKSFISRQVLMYPATDYYHYRVYSEYDSIIENGDGYVLTNVDMSYFWTLYLGDEMHAANSYASPIRARDFNNLPPTLLITAEYDPLRDEGELYGVKLRQAGTHVQAKRFDGMIHGFVSLFPDQKEGREALELIRDFVNTPFVMQK